MPKTSTVSDDVEAIETGSNPFANIKTVPASEYTASSRGRAPRQEILDLRKAIEDAGKEGQIGTIACTPEQVKEYGDMIRSAGKVSGMPKIEVFSTYNRSGGVLQFGLRSLKPVKKGK